MTIKFQCTNSDKYAIGSRQCSIAHVSAVPAQRIVIEATKDHQEQGGRAKNADSGQRHIAAQSAAIPPAKRAGKPGSCDSKAALTVA
jgi:hypothetical protein